jgi:hypothetical protein
MEMRPYRDIVSGEERKREPVPTQCKSGACALRRRLEPSGAEAARPPAGKGGKQ